MGARINKSTNLTIKEAKFVKKYIETGNGTEAANQVYDVKDRRTAWGVAQQNMRRPRVREALDKAMREQKLTPAYIVQAMKKNIDEGAGVKATAKDANTAIDMYLKLNHLYDTGLDQDNYKLTITKSDDHTITAQLSKQTDKSAHLLNSL